MPEIDFYRGTLLTNNVVEAMRRTGLHRLLYASGSGVYGDTGETLVAEDYAPMMPVSTYGASKLACESLIASYCSMFGLRACAFRFGNVVGPRQTHGVGFDFLRSLHARPNRLRILGDGQQSKPYIHVTDVVRAALCAAGNATAPFSVFNVATDDAVTVDEIARSRGRDSGSGRHAHPGIHRGPPRLAGRRSRGSPGFHPYALAGLVPEMEQPRSRTPFAAGDESR